MGCSRSYNQPALTHVQLIDRNGVNETISQKERLDVLQRVDFLEAQPYQKVVRVFKRDSEGRIVSRLTTYHNNGEVFQYLEVIGGRANGVYKEWHENGKLRICGHVMEGAGDLSPEAQATWVFDGESKVWDREGNLLAELCYEKGKLEGEALYYYPSGRIYKSIPYKNDRVNGDSRIYDANGNYVGGTHYVNGKMDGRSFFAGNEVIPKREEFYQGDLLMSGVYFDLKGKETHTIKEGNGIKPAYEEGFLRTEYDYRKGKLEGLVKMYRKNGDLETMYQLIDGQKQGDEWSYYERKNREEELKPLLQINWHDDEIFGVVRTWYPNGVLESEKDMVGNKKQGKLLAWYEDGSLMMIEEYENEILVSGKYFKRGEEFPISRVTQGTGFATMYDAQGNFMKKIEYQKGLPIE